MNMNEQMKESGYSVFTLIIVFLLFLKRTGCYLYDSEERNILHFAGRAVVKFGYHYPGYDEALKIDR